jgi:type IV secretory pathway TraG/TraD family ATPase VirD4
MKPPLRTKSVGTKVSEAVELAAMIDKGAAAQRSGVLGSLNMVADAFKLLPKESETTRRWSTVEWAKERKGWVFLTSKPTMRERMRPLISLWLDLLVLRMMNEESMRKKTWFVLDELASLQRLPQLTTAVTENRKSNNPMVLGFQGKAQVEALYGHVAEAMLSQPATKIFLKTSEPNASEWISKAGVPGDIWTSSYERDFVSRSWTWHEGRSTQLSRW